MSATISLTHGQLALVDDEDVERLSVHRWSAIRSKSRSGAHVGWYAVATIGGRITYMHRLLIGAPAGVLVDHANREKLDNRKINLRLSTRSQNAANKPTHANSTGFRGVFVDRRNGVYRAGISSAGRWKWGRSQPSPEQAARDYDALARAAFGDFATFNFGGTA